MPNFDTHRYCFKCREAGKGDDLCMLKKYCFIALIHPIQLTIANPVSADRPAKRQKDALCRHRPAGPSSVHSPGGASYFLLV